MEEQVAVPRLGVYDKRALFSTLIAMVDRLFYLNKFPVDMEDFALSCLRPDVEQAFRLLKRELPKTVYRSKEITFHMQSSEDSNKMWNLHGYPDQSIIYGNIFPITKEPIVLVKENRFFTAVNEWCRRQARLEEQILRAGKVIKAIVHSCNTVGQYERVSPELITFLPDKYKIALKEQSKKSPYPAITVAPEEIETTMATLAYASLQPQHKAEESYIAAGNNRWQVRSRYYRLDPFPRSASFNHGKVRELGI